jgi:dihydroorotate dehydrogenase electron transfer subunit
MKSEGSRMPDSASSAVRNQDGLPRAYTIAKVRVENPAIHTFVLHGEVAAHPGQFVMAWLPRADTGRPSDEKPFSLSGAAPIALTVDRVGPFTEAMHALRAGDRLWLRGPFGRGFTVRPGPLMLISGGCGAAPLLYLAQVARQMGRQVAVVLGARSETGLLFQDRFSDLGCSVHVATDDGSAGARGTALDLAASLLCAEGIAANTLYACGPEPMLEAVHRLAVAHGLPCQLSYEAYMRCAIGVCGSCARGGYLVCHDGPVFDQPPSSPKHHSH